MKSPCHTIIFSENLVMTNMSYPCPVSLKVSSDGHMQDFDYLSQVLGLPGFMLHAHAPCSSGDHWWNSQ